MQTPPLPPGDSGRKPDAPAPAEATPEIRPADAAEAGPSTVLRPPTVRTDPGPESAPVQEDVLADLFGADQAKVTDESPTVITKNAHKSPIDEAVAEKAVADSLRGRRLAHFELVEPVGVGGMAAVIRARDTQLDRTVALKVLPPEMADDPENVRRFHQEARSAAKLDHENIARVFFCGEDQRLHFIAFEFVEGDNLRTLMERRGRLPVQEAMHYMMQIAAGLAHAAARGVVHRDIKPSNIIISPNGRAKLVDMGLARMAETQTDHALTQSGVTLGTFDYISPEQALEPRDADVRSDIYSLGCTFYHVLTGQSPVPEGTAAKKLHHHQNEPPLDPRQLNPEISDEVAMILGRMMAKDPKARYQRAEHLLQHLHVVAQRFGVPTEGQSTSLPYLDGPLPDPPRTRPLLVAGLAAMILLVSVLFLGRTGRTKDGRNGSDPPHFDAQNKESGQRVMDGDPKRTQPIDTPAAAVTAGASEPHNAANERDLIELAREKRGDDAELNVVLTGNHYEFPATGDEGVLLPPTLTARKVVLRAKDPSKKPVVRFVYDVQQQGQLGAAMNRVLALFIDADEVLIENVRFILDGRGNRLGNMAGIVLTGREKAGTETASFIVRDCEFIQAGQPGEPTGARPSSVVLNSPGRKPSLKLENCSFLGYEEATADQFKNVRRGGLDAVTLKTPAKELLAVNCAFGPHYALFRIEKGADGSDVKARHCAGILVGESAAFHVAGDKTSCKLDIKYSWLAGLNPPPPFGNSDRWRGSALLRQDGNMAITYKGEDNRFYRLDAFWVRPTAADPEYAMDLREFQNRGMEEDSIPITSPVRFWKSGDPIIALERGDIATAFMVNDQSPELRAGQGKGLVGLTGWGKQHFLPVTEKTSVAGRKTLIVDPTVKTDGNGTYPDLAGAFAAIARSPQEEAEVLLKFDGYKELSPVSVDKHIKVTIRPAPASRPIVGIEQSRDRNSFLFQIIDGEVTLEDLEIRVQPNAPLSAGLRSQAVVGMPGDGRCTFRNCWVTLDPAGRDVPIAVVAVSDPETLQMRMDNMPQSGKGCRIQFDTCGVRGDGDLITSHAVRPFEAEVNNVWTALSGSLLYSDGVRDENAMPAEPVSATQLKLTQVTAYLPGYMLRLRADKMKYLTPVSVVSLNSIFQAAGVKSLVHLEGPNPGAEILKSLVQWNAKNNIYGGFEFRLDNQPPSDQMPAPPIGKTEWQRQPDETNPQIIQSALTPPGDLTLIRALPDQFRLKENIAAGQGAVLGSLPKPGAESPQRSDGKSE
jgi:serine/threonine protein kinase